MQLPNEPRHEKICIRGFRRGQTQTGLYNLRKKMARGLNFSDLENRGTLLFM